MHENSPEGISYIYQKSGNCFNCNAEVEVSSAEIFNKEFVCPICGAKNKIELSRSARRMNLSKGISVIEGKQGTCCNCKVFLEVSDEELADGKFICPECGTENSIETKNAALKKWIPIIPVILILITIYLFGSISSVISFKKEMIEYDTAFKSYFIDGIIGVKIIVWVLLAFFAYAYFKNKYSLKKLVNRYIIVMIAASLIQAFFLYYSVYLLFDNSSVISSGNTDWDKISETVKIFGLDKLFTIKETIITTVFLFGLLFGAHQFFSALGNENKSPY